MPRAPIAFLLAISLLLLPVGALPAAQASSSLNLLTGAAAETDSAPSNATAQARSVLSLFSEIRSNNQRKAELGVEIELLENRVSPGEAEREKLLEEVRALEEGLRFLRAGEDTADEIRFREDELADVTKLLQDTESQLQQDEQQRRSRIALLRAEYAALSEQVETLRAFFKQEVENLVWRIVIFVSLAALLFVLREVAARAIARFSGHLTAARREVLLRLNRIVFSVLLGVLVLVALFSQLLSILPFLAILGTALAFALRDIITSFIGWFVIGTREGFVPGDLVEIGAVRGRVMEIHPLLTVLRQTGLSGETGRIVSVPNKVIFDEKIINFSKMRKVIFVAVDVFLDAGSNVAAAQKAMEKAVEKGAADETAAVAEVAPAIARKFGLSAERLVPVVLLADDPRGIMLRGKFPVRLENRFVARSAVVSEFFKAIHGKKDIKVHFVPLPADISFTS